MTWDYFERAVDSMVGYPKMTGLMGGEPLLHPDFEGFCEYALSKIPKEQLGLWTSFPKGYEHYRDIICETFGNIFLNDHTKGDIYHCPILVGIEEVYADPGEMYYVIDHCWLQNAWSASINPKGAFFCEIAAAMELLFDEFESGWLVEPGWWWRTPKDFKEQIEKYCPKCGASIPLKRRVSVDGRDDISNRNYLRLKDRSKKIKKGQYVMSDLQLDPNPAEMASYKDPFFRDGIARRYGIYLVVNEKGFQTPYLGTAPVRTKTLFEEIRDASEGVLL